jgi:hypothetical protein
LHPVQCRTALEAVWKFLKSHYFVGSIRRTIRSFSKYNPVSDREQGYFIRASDGRGGENEEGRKDEDENDDEDKRGHGSKMRG